MFYQFSSSFNKCKNFDEKYHYHYENDATTATPETSFSMIRKIKTWLHPTMKQLTFNAFAFLNPNKSLVNDFRFFTEENLR